MEDKGVPFVDLGLKHRELGHYLVAAIGTVLNKGDFVLGSDVEKFEAEFASYLGVKHCVGVATGSDALHLSLRALGVGEGHEVIVPAMTFAASAFGVCYAGAKPVFVDVSERNCGLDPVRIEAAITPRTRAILPVHLYGFPAAMDEILEIAARRNLFVVEDACQAHGALYKGRRAGSSGDAAAFSFFPSKNLGAMGDGGMVATSSDEVAARLRLLRNYGQPAKYVHESVGYNSRLDTLQAAVLGVKLAKLDAWNAQRREAAALYRALLASVPVGLHSPLEGTEPVYHVFSVLTERRDELQASLKAAGIGTGLHYNQALHLQKCFLDLGGQPGDFPVAEKVARQTLSLPMFPGITKEQVETVAERVRAFFR
ncbi:MAG: DegT/DnrJ/EryC1/StrS family aminotransferase [Elusimicrobia bacterium]|nr:DegT/DnrJ/EryC1/StrS family aminotransferase [Elusimicrobiota bacterium]